MSVDSYLFATTGFRGTYSEAAAIGRRPPFRLYFR